MFKSAILFGTGLCGSPVLRHGWGDIQSNQNQITLYKNTTGTIDFNTMMVPGDEMAWTYNHSHLPRKPSHFISDAVDSVSPSGCRTQVNAMYCIKVSSQALEIGATTRVTDVIRCSSGRKCYLQANLTQFASWEIFTTLKLTRAEWTKYFSLFITALHPDWLSPVPELKIQLTDNLPAYLYFKPLRWCITARYYHKSSNGIVSGYFTVKFPLVSESNALLGTYGTANPCLMSYLRASIRDEFGSHNPSTYSDLLGFLC